MELGSNQLLMIAVGGPILIVLFGFLLKAACDLCSVEPSPHIVRCLVVALIMTAIGVPLGYAAYWLAKSAGLTESSLAVAAIVIFLVAFAIISTLLFIPALGVRPIKGARIWLVHTLINSVVVAVGAMLVIGGWTTIDSIRRLF